VEPTTQLPKCVHCGGTASMRQHVAAGLKAHNLCVARAKRGAATPSLGDECPTCRGAGCIPKSKYGPINPNQAAMDAWAPPCGTCAGKGVLGAWTMTKVLSNGKKLWTRPASGAVEYAVFADGDNHAHLSSSAANVREAILEAEALLAEVR
jgi:hypothetical protein